MSNTLQNPDVEKYFAPLSAHSDVAEEFLVALEKLGEYECRGGPGEWAALYAVTNDVIFGAAAGMSETFWRLRPADIEIALATGAQRTDLGPEWVKVTLFRCDWPKPDLAYWALRAYDFARTGD